jgi:hypothetical protein
MPQHFSGHRGEGGPRLRLSRARLRMRCGTTGHSRTPSVYRKPDISDMAVRLGRSCVVFRTIYAIRRRADDDLVQPLFNFLC